MKTSGVFGLCVGCQLKLEYLPANFLCDTIDQRFNNFSPIFMGILND